jgi:hypothetical protein
MTFRVGIRYTASDSAAMSVNHGAEVPISNLSSWTVMRWPLNARNASARPTSAPARSQVQGESDAFGKRSIMFMATISARAAK